MTEKEFGGGFWPLETLPELSQDEIRTMPMLYRANSSFARDTCPLLVPFLEAYRNSGLGHQYKYESLDVKVAMLKPGWWPCIPGWHLDDFYRPTNEQPDIRELHHHPSSHLMVLFGDASLTEFVDQRIDLPLPPKDAIVYSFYNKEIEEKKPRTVVVKPNVVYRFGSFDFHRGMPATKSGWRAFVRLTLSNHRAPKNEIRSQVQVYVPHDELFRGW